MTKSRSSFFLSIRTGKCAWRVTRNNKSLLPRPPSPGSYNCLVYPTVHFYLTIRERLVDFWVVLTKECLLWTPTTLTSPLDSLCEKVKRRHWDILNKSKVFSVSVIMDIHQLIKFLVNSPDESSWNGPVKIEINLKNFTL